MKIELIFAILIGVQFILIIGCGNKMPLPQVESSPESFGANDTSYIHLNLVWDAATIGYNPTNPMTPADITIGEDGYIFVADSANDRVISISAAGNLATHQNLDKIAPIIAPIGVDIDTKLNLLIVNGTNTIYVWNQYLNNIGVDSVLTGITANNRLIFSANPAKIDSVMGIHQFYQDEDEGASFQGVAFGPSNDSTVFVTDKGNNRIVQLKIIFGGAVKLKNKQIHSTFKGVFDKAIATYGSGAGTVDNPKGITVDDDGNVYFTQLGGNFFVQKLQPQGSHYSSYYTLYEDPIMDLNQFAGPHDITLGNNDAIFVLDTANGKVVKFFNKGSRAAQKANLGKKGLVEAIFNRPLGIAISDDEIVYIADTGNHRIDRYQFSVSEEDLPVEQPKR